MSNTSARKSSVRIAASVALVAGATAVAGLGTFGSFTSSTDAAQAVASGDTEILIGSASVLEATGLVPGDTVQRAMVLTRGTKTEGFGSVKLTTAAGVANMLTTDTVNGLQMTVDQCAVAWVPAAKAKELECTSGQTNVVSSTPVIGSAVDVAKVATSLNDSGSSYLRVTLALPTAAGNDFKNLATSVNFKFDATQRTAQSR